MTTYLTDLYRKLPQKSLPPKTNPMEIKTSAVSLVLNQTKKIFSKQFLNKKVSFHLNFPRIFYEFSYLFKNKEPEVAPVTETKQPSVPIQFTEDGPEGLITRALIVGNFEAAVDCCVKTDRMVRSLHRLDSRSSRLDKTYLLSP